MNGILQTRDLIIHLGENDKYGRVLAKIILDGIDLSTDLVNRKLVFSYAGDTKMTLLEQANFCINNPANYI
jgi:hypothetical protein